MGVRFARGVLLCGRLGFMRTAYSVDTVRAAERALMARLPEGALMQRAAAGLAVVCAELLGKVYGARVVLLVGSGDNGGDALYAGARLARRGAGVAAVLLDSERVHRAGLAAFLSAGGASPTAVNGFLPGPISLSTGSWALGGGVGFVRVLCLLSVLPWILVPLSFLWICPAASTPIRGRSTGRPSALM